MEVPRVAPPLERAKFLSVSRRLQEEADEAERESCELEARLESELRASRDGVEQLMQECEMKQHRVLLECQGRVHRARLDQEVDFERAVEENRRAVEKLQRDTDVISRELVLAWRSVMRRSGELKSAAGEPMQVDSGNEMEDGPYTTSWADDDEECFVGELHRDPDACAGGSTEPHKPTHAPDFHVDCDAADADPWSATSSCSSAEEKSGLVRVPSGEASRFERPRSTADLSRNRWQCQPPSLESRVEAPVSGGDVRRDAMHGCFADSPGRPAKPQSPTTPCRSSAGKYDFDLEQWMVETDPYEVSEAPEDSCTYTALQSLAVELTPTPAETPPPQKNLAVAVGVAESQELVGNPVVTDKNGARATEPSASAQPASLERSAHSKRVPGCRESSHSKNNTSSSCG